MSRAPWILLAAIVVVPACSSSGASPSPLCLDGQKNGDETGIDCGGSCPWTCTVDGTRPGDGLDGGPADCQPGEARCAPGRPDDGIMNNQETDVDCGGPNAPKCAADKACLADTDCNGACNYSNKCVDVPSCKPHLGGDTCGKGEVGQTDAAHESCCRTLPVSGFSDPAHPGKQVYLDKYEITAGRVRTFLADVASKNGGRPDVRAWIAANTPAYWDASWDKWMPTDNVSDTVLVKKELLGDPRGPEWGSPIPAADQLQNVGVDFQFNGQLFVYLHGNNCSTHTPTAFGFPTWFYPAEVLAKMGPSYPPRADGTNWAGALVPAAEHLEVKAMNCIPNALLAAFCAWDGGQLATSEVLDYVTATPAELGNKAGCGTQVFEDPPESAAATSGGRCADLAKINATYDAGASLPLPNHPLNANNYAFPYFDSSVMYDKAWEVAAPGRGSLAAQGEQIDTVRINPGDEPWMDLAGNLNEAVLTTSSGAFTGKFGLKFRGIGYQSARSLLNLRDDWPGEEGVARITRPEARGGFAGGRCMRFK